MAETGQGSPAKADARLSKTQHDGATDRDKVSFSRPGLTVYLNLLATLLFAVTGMLYFLSGKTWFGVGWWIIGALWLRRYFWARGTPLLEIDRRDILVHVGPYRVRPLPLAQVVDGRLEGGKVVLRLDDASTVKFSSFDLMKSDMERFLALVEARKGGQGPPMDDVQTEG